MIRKEKPTKMLLGWNSNKHHETNKFFFNLNNERYKKTILQKKTSCCKMTKGKNIFKLQQKELRVARIKCCKESKALKI